MEILEWIRSHALALPNLAKFALAMAILVGVPPLSRRLRLPPVVGLLLCGVVIGSHVLGVFAVHPSIADFFADLGKLLLMFFAGLEIDLALFRRARTMWRRGERNRKQRRDDQQRKTSPDFVHAADSCLAASAVANTDSTSPLSIASA